MFLTKVWFKKKLHFYRGKKYLQKNPNVIEMNCLKNVSEKNANKSYVATTIEITTTIEIIISIVVENEFQT